MFLKLNGNNVPIPLIIERANELTINDITNKISEAKNTEFTDKEIVLQKKTKKWEKAYYFFARLPKKVILEV